MIAKAEGDPGSCASIGVVGVEINGDAGELKLASSFDEGPEDLLDRLDGVSLSPDWLWPGVDCPDLSPSCKACTSKGVADPLYLALIASRRLRRCSIRAASSRGSASGSGALIVGA